jgi:aryl-alcohol dehydrogenase-like predicted oxidoreductase
LGIALVPHSPLGRGFLTGSLTSTSQLAQGDERRNFPRFEDENFQKNLALLQPLSEIALEVGATPAQVALAWLLAQGEDIVPVPGTKRRAYLEQNAAAVEIMLGDEQLARLDVAIPKGAAAGQRHADMSTVDR